MEEAKTLCEPLGESALMSGDLCYAGCGRNLLYQCWGQLGVDRNHIRMGSEALAISILEEALQILEETPNLPH